MIGHTCSTTDNGLFQIMSMTSDIIPGAMDVMRGSFFLHEKVCIGVELSRHSEACKELEELNARIAAEGTSLVALEKKTGKVVGVAFNKLQVKSEGQDSYFEQYLTECKTPSAKTFLQFMIDADNAANLFDLCKGSCVLELVSLAVLPDFRGKGVGGKLFETFVALGKVLSGDGCVKGFDYQRLLSQPLPVAMSATCTTVVTQHLAEKLGFSSAFEKSYETSMFEGKSLGSRIGADTLSAVVEYKVL